MGMGHSVVLGHGRAAGGVAVASKGSIELSIEGHDHSLTNCRCAGVGFGALVVE